MFKKWVIQNLLIETGQSSDLITVTLAINGKDQNCGKDERGKERELESHLRKKSTGYGDQIVILSDQFFTFFHLVEALL